MLVNLHIYMLPSLINMCITYYQVCVQVPGVLELQNVISSLWTTSPAPKTVLKFIALARS